MKALKVSRTPRICFMQETRQSLIKLAKAADSLNMVSLRNYYLKKAGVSMHDVLMAELAESFASNGVELVVDNNIIRVRV